MLTAPPPPRRPRCWLACWPCRLCMRQVRLRGRIRLGRGFRGAAGYRAQRAPAGHRARCTHPVRLPETRPSLPPICRRCLVGMAGAGAAAGAGGGTAGWVGAAFGSCGKGWFCSKQGVRLRRVDPNRACVAAQDAVGAGQAAEATAVLPAPPIALPQKTSTCGPPARCATLRTTWRSLTWRHLPPS